MKRKSIEFVYSFENPNTPAEFESILKKILIEKILSLRSETPTAVS